MWGYNAYGQLGDNTITNKSSPVYVVGENLFVVVVAGGAHSLSMKSDGSVWSWGLNNVGQLGDNAITSRSSPVAVFGGHSFVEISGSYSHSLARKADGSVWGWGNNDSGELGDNTPTDQSSPVAVVGGHSFVEISGGYYHSLALKADGTWTGGISLQRSFNDGLTWKTVYEFGDNFEGNCYELGSNVMYKFVVTTLGTDLAVLLAGK